MGFGNSNLTGWKPLQPDYLTIPRTFNFLWDQSKELSIIDVIHLKFLCDIYDEKIKVNFLTKMTPDDWMRVSTKKVTHALHLFRSITSTYWFINRLKTFGYLEVHEVWYGATRFGKSKMFDGTKFAYRPTDKAREYFEKL